MVETSSGQLDFKQIHKTLFEQVTKFWKHESYDHNTITNDISVLKLDKPLEFNEYVQPIKMAELGTTRTTS